MFKRRPYFLQARDQCLELGTVTRIMGILNLTPDSFSGDGILYPGKDHAMSALCLARRMIRAGADIIDVGGESTRPGASPVTAEEEIRRVVPVIRLLAKKTHAIISIDTSKPKVAQAAFKAGAHILNLIKGTPVSDELLRLCRQYKAAIILMHMRGTPQTMQKRAVYRDVVAEVIAELKKSVEKCRRFGLNECAVAVDPGIGFAKTAEQNLLLMRRLPDFARLKCPVLVGTSRKSFIGQVLGLDIGKRSMGTAATIASAIYGGAHIVRVHDVTEMKQIALMTDAIVNSSQELIR